MDEELNKQFLVPPSYRYSNDFAYIEKALIERWQPFRALVDEFKSFSPQPIEELRADELKRVRARNPDMPEENLREYVEGQIKYFGRADVQFALKFGDRLMVEYVTVAILSHALCESIINAILAITLALRKTPEVFELIERSELVEKWTVALKAISPKYAFPTGSALDETLRRLVRQRNVLIHYKIELEVDEERIFNGSPLRRDSLQDQIAWIERYFSLPYDLNDYVVDAIADPRLHILLGPNPIQRVAVHKIVAQNA